MRPEPTERIHFAVHARGRFHGGFDSPENCHAAVPTMGLKRRSSTLQVRSASTRDAATLSILLRELGFPTSPGQVKTRLKALRGHTLVAVRGSKVVGLLTTNVMRVLHRPTPVGRLSALVVAEGERNSGVGRALVEAAQERLRKRGCALVEVTSNLRYGKAHAFYEHLGYEHTSFRFKKSLP